MSLTLKFMYCLNILSFILNIILIIMIIIDHI